MGGPKLEVPKDFKPIQDVYYSNPDAHEKVNIIGSVSDMMPPTKTRTGEYMVTFRLLFASDGLLVRFFNKDADSLPDVQNLGDVLLIRNIKIVSLDGNVALVSSPETLTCVFPRGNIDRVNGDDASCDGLEFKVGKKVFGIGRHTTREHHKYIVQLRRDSRFAIEALEEMRGSKRRAAAAPEASEEPLSKKGRTNLGGKYRTISNVSHFDFADLVGQVVKKFPANYGTDLYITDYTENKSTQNYPHPNADLDSRRDGDDYGYSANRSKNPWPGPYGHMVLKINVRDPHAQYVNQEVNEGDFVFLRNVKIHNSKQLPGILEGDMWPDNLYRDKLLASKLHKGDSRVETILYRKEQYWSAQAQLHLDQKDSENLEAGSATAQPKKLSKKQKRLAKAAQRQTETPPQSAPQVMPQPSEEPQRTLNHHIHIDHGRSSIRDIVTGDVPLHILEARVVDYAPTLLEEFAVPREGNDQFEWLFALQLEDEAGDRLWVCVDHKEALHLLGTGFENAGALDTDKTMLARLREKLCILWGNLEETKGQGEEAVLSNLKFQCFVREHYVDGKRAFKMCKVAIE